MVICLEQGADLHTAQMMPLPLTVSCFSKIQIGFTSLAPAHRGSPGKGPLKECANVCVFKSSRKFPPQRIGMHHSRKLWTIKQTIPTFSVFAFFSSIILHFWSYQYKKMLVAQRLPCFRLVSKPHAKCGHIHQWQLSSTDTQTKCDKVD